MEFYLDETFEPETEVGKKLKRMVENGEHCDGNVYWLIKEVETLNKRYEILAEYKHSIDVAKMKVETEMLKKTKLHM